MAKKYHLATQKTKNPSRTGHSVNMGERVYEIYTTGEGGISEIPSDVVRAFQSFVKQRVSQDKGLTYIALNISESRGI